MWYHFLSMESFRWLLQTSEDILQLYYQEQSSEEESQEAEPYLKQRRLIDGQNVVASCPGEGCMEKDSAAVLKVHWANCIVLMLCCFYVHMRGAEQRRSIRRICRAIPSLATWGALSQFQPLYRSHGLHRLYPTTSLYHLVMQPFWGLSLASLRVQSATGGSLGASIDFSSSCTGATCSSRGKIQEDNWAESWKDFTRGILLSIRTAVRSVRGTFAGSSSERVMLVVGNGAGALGSRPVAGHDGSRARAACAEAAAEDGVSRKREQRTTKSW